MHLRFPGLPREPQIWVPEDSLAGIFWCHEMALELVCRSDFWCNRRCKTSPVDLEGFWGQVWPKIGRKPTHKFPARLPSGTRMTETKKKKKKKNRMTERHFPWLAELPASGSGCRVSGHKALGERGAIKLSSPGCEPLSAGWVPD